MGRGGAGGDRGEVGPLKPGLDRDITGGHVGDHHRDEENRDPFGAFLVIGPAGGLKALHPADAAANNDADPVGVEVIEVGPAVFEGVQRRRDGKLAEAVHPLGLFAVHPLGGVKIPDLGRHLNEGQVVDAGDG